MTPRDGFPNAFGLGLSGWGFRAAQGLWTGPMARDAGASPRHALLAANPNLEAWGEAVSMGHYQRSLV